MAGETIIEDCELSNRTGDPIVVVDCGARAILRRCVFSYTMEEAVKAVGANTRVYVDECHVYPRLLRGRANHHQVALVRMFNISTKREWWVKF